MVNREPADIIVQFATVFLYIIEIKRVKNGGGGGSRTRVRRCYWSRDYMLIPVHALGITPGRSRPPLRTDKKRVPLACDLNLTPQT